MHTLEFHFGNVACFNVDLAAAATDRKIAQPPGTETASSVPAIGAPEAAQSRAREAAWLRHVRCDAHSVGVSTEDFGTLLSYLVLSRRFSDDVNSLENAMESVQSSLAHLDEDMKKVMEDTNRAHESTEIIEESNHIIEES